MGTSRWMGSDFGGRLLAMTAASLPFAGEAERSAGQEVLVDHA